MSRLQTLQAGKARTARVCTAIRAAAGSTSRHSVNVVRLLPNGQVISYDWHPDRRELSPDAAEAVTQLMHTLRPDIDWAVAHDYHLTTGMLRSSPAAGERGYAPEVEGCFGGSDPVFLPPASGLTRTETAA